MEEQQGPDPTQFLIEDLSQRVAGANLEAAQWKTRALFAEKALADIEAAEVDEEEEVADDGV